MAAETATVVATSTVLTTTTGVVLAVLPQNMADGTVTGNSGKGRFLYHYSPNETLGGPLRPGSYLTDVSGLTVNQAIRQLALDKPLGTQLYTYIFSVQPYEYIRAPNSIPNTNFVRPANGQLGWGIEYVNTVPLVPIAPPFPTAQD